jgi:hypothetical protein
MAAVDEFDHEWVVVQKDILEFRQIILKIIKEMRKSALRGMTSRMSDYLTQTKKLLEKGDAGFLMGRLTLKQIAEAKVIMEQFRSSTALFVEHFGIDVVV